MRKPYHVQMGVAALAGGNNKTEVTSVKLVLFKYVMLFETMTKVDQLTEILRFGLVRF